MRFSAIRIMKSAESKSPLTKTREDINMALSNLFGWDKKDGEKKAAAAACGATEAPAACGAAEAPAACGAADKPEEKPAACGADDK